MWKRSPASRCRSRITNARGGSATSGSHAWSASMRSAQRISSELTASLEAYARCERIGEQVLRVDTIYDKDIGQFQALLFGGVNGAATALKLVAALTEK